jgi:hypothetical protein
LSPVRYGPVGRRRDQRGHADQGLRGDHGIEIRLAQGGLPAATQDRGIEVEEALEAQRLPLAIGIGRDEADLGRHRDDDFGDLDFGHRAPQHQPQPGRIEYPVAGRRHGRFDLPHCASGSI